MPRRQWPRGSLDLHPERERHLQLPGISGTGADRKDRALAGCKIRLPTVVLRSRSQMRSIVQNAPEGFGKDPARFRSDVIFLRAPITARVAMEQVRAREGVDRAWPGSGVLYFQRLARRVSQSQLGK